MRKDEFVAGMALIEAAVGKKPPETLTAFWWFVVEDIPNEDWVDAVRQYGASLRERPDSFPLPAALLNVPGEMAPDSESLDIEVLKAWEQVLECYEYTPLAGRMYNSRRVREECGEATHRAVIASGGYGQLLVCGTDEAKDWAFRRFQTAYLAQIKAGAPRLADAMLPPADDQKQIGISDTAGLISPWPGGTRND